MNYFSNLDIINARRTPLKGVLLHLKYTLQPEENGNFKVKGYQGLLIKEHYWHQNSTQLSGNTIDFFTKIEKTTFQQAIEIILNLKITQSKGPHWKFSNDTALAKKYLTNHRKIDHQIVNQLIQQGQLKQDAANCICFLQADATKKIRYIFRRSMSNDHFKGEVKNSQKEFSFEINLKGGQIVQQQKKIDSLYLVEGAIDACAMATLLKIKNKSSERIKIISTAGNPHRSLKNRIQSAQANKIIIATDMDPAGRKIANIIESMMLTSNYSTPKYTAKDPSQLLINITK
jgi:5S rRNA maturation endonuclease (ribonuclease M5)